jgi:hypothetical protein
MSKDKNREFSKGITPKKQQDVNIEKGRFNEGIGRPQKDIRSWQPTKDHTESKPPSGGSGVSKGNS